MRAMTFALATMAALGMSVSPAAALELKEHIAVPEAPAKVWPIVADLCSIKDWNPIVADCVVTQEGDATIRTLTYNDGSKIKEKIDDSDDWSYSYEILASPLPIKNYKATLSIAPGEGAPDQSVITWDTTFDANGISDEEALKKIGGLLKGGLNGIKQRAISLSEGASGAPKN